MQEHSTNSPDPILEQIQEEGPKAYGKRLLRLASTKEFKDGSQRQRLYEQYGRELVDQVIRDFPDLPLSQLEDELKAFS